MLTMIIGETPGVVDYKYKTMSWLSLYILASYEYNVTPEDDSTSRNIYTKSTVSSSSYARIIWSYN
jgi:hypothetical protein